MGKIVKLQINKVKGEPPIEVEISVAEQGVGIIGDRHVGAGNRDVCICRKELVDWMESQEVQGLCFGRHKENVQLEGFSSEELIPGKYLVGEEVELEISDFPKHCFPEACEFAKTGKRCLLREEYQMARIIKSGTMKLDEHMDVK